MRVLQSQRKRPLDLLAISANGYVAAACSLFTVRAGVDVWDIASDVRSRFAVSFYQEHEITSLAFTPDGRNLLIGLPHHTIHIVDVEEGSAFTILEATLRNPLVALSPDGSHLFATEYMNQAGVVECWEMKSDLTFRNLWSDDPHEFEWFDRPAVSPDGSRVVVPFRAGVTGLSRNGIDVRDAATGTSVLGVWFDPAEPVEEAAFSTDGTQLLARSRGRVVQLFDAATGQPAGELLHPGRPFVTGMAVHPNGTVATSRNNGTVCLWDLSKRELVRTFDWKLGKLVSVAFAPDGSVGAAGTEDGQVVVWDVDE